MPHPLRPTPAPTRPTRRLVLGGLALGAAALAAPGRAAAHAILVDSDPPALGRVAAGHIGFRLRFNSRIDRGRSRLVLLRPDKSESVLAIGADSTESELRTEATLAAGAYTIRWQVLAIDGHITRGDLPFSVTAP